MKKPGHSKSVFTHKSSVEVDGNIHMQSDAEVADYSIKTLPEEMGVRRSLHFLPMERLWEQLGILVRKMRMERIHIPSIVL